MRWFRTIILSARSAPTALVPLTSAVVLPENGGTSARTNSDALPHDEQLM